MDIATVIGLVSGVVILLFGTITMGLNPLSLLDIPSVLVTFGGGVSEL